MEILKVNDIQNTEDQRGTIIESSSGELLLKHKGKWVAFYCKPSFPWSAPMEQISLIDQEGQVLRIIASPFDLSPSEQELILNGLSKNGFVFEIKDVIEIVEEFELRSWLVETHQGNRKFQSAIEAWPRPLPDGSFLIEDVGGDLYRLKEETISNCQARPAVEALVY